MEGEQWSAVGCAELSCGWRYRGEGAVAPVGAQPLLPAAATIERGRHTAPMGEARRRVLLAQLLMSHTRAGRTRRSRAAVGAASKAVRETRLSKV